MEQKPFNPWNPPDRDPQLNYRERRGLSMIIGGVIFLFFAYVVSFKLNQFIFQENGQSVTYRRADHPTTFIAIAAAATVVGAVILTHGLRLLFGNNNAGSQVGARAPSGGGHTVFWGTLNAALIIVAAFGGYVGLNSQRLAGTNPDWILCIAAFFGVMLVPISRPHFAAVSELRKPQWGRCPFKWGYDPLQSLFVETFWLAGLVLGQAARFFTSDLRSNETAMWTVLVYAAILGGWVVGQIITYGIYRNRIED